VEGEGSFTWDIVGCILKMFWFHCLLARWGGLEEVEGKGVLKSKVEGASGSVVRVTIVIVCQGYCCHFSCHVFWQDNRRLRKAGRIL
jgi:hypothetical protein